MKKITKRLAAILLLVVFTLNLAAPYGSVSMAAESKQDEMVFEGNGFVISYQIDQRWDNGYNASISITNTGETAIDNWCIAFEQSNKIVNIWNARIKSEQNNSYIIQNLEWNQDIKKGETVSFGFTASGKFAGFPEKYSLNGSLRAVEDEDYLVEYQMADRWQEGFTGTIVIYNKSEQALEDWELEFSMDSSISQIWNAEIISENNGKYVAKGCSYNQNIKKGESVSFGFLCSDGENNMPRDFKMKIISLEPEATEETETSDVEEPELNPETVLDYVNIDLKEGNTYDSVIDDITFLNAAPDDIQVTWDISDTDVISPEGEVTRQKKDVNVKIKAKILFQEKEYEKSFELTVAAVSEYERDKIRDLNIREIDEMNADEEEYESDVNDLGYLENVMGCYSDVKVDSYESALYSLYSVRSAIGITDPFSELKVFDAKSDDTGYIFKFNQMYKGIPVFGNQVVVSSDKNGKVDSLVSDYFPVDESLDVNAGMDYEQAVQKLKEKYSDIERIEGEEELYVFNDFGTCSLVWKVGFYSGSKQDDLEEGQYMALVNAGDGTIESLSGMENDANNRVANTGKDVLKKLRGFYINKKTSLFDDPTYVLEDTRRNIAIYNARWKKEGQVSGSSKIEKLKPIWLPTEISALANMNDVYDYYKEKLNRISYNDALFPFASKEVKVYINVDLEDNAVWDNNGHFIFGYGTGGRYVEDRCWVAALDVVGHEFTHAVTMYETDLEACSYGVSRSIKEAYSDIMACYMDGNWLFGEDLTSALSIRNIKAPGLTRNPTEFGGDYFFDYHQIMENESRSFKLEDNDYGGVHTNSTILSHIAYQMQKSENFRGKRLDKLWYLSLCLGYRTNSDFYDVRRNVIKAAKKLDYSKEEISEIKKIFNEAKVTKKNCRESEKYFKAAARCAGKSSYSTAAVNLSLTGKVVSADTDHDNTNDEVADDVDICLMDLAQDQTLCTGFTDEEGEYWIFPQPQDAYCMKLTGKGFLDEIMYVDGINELLQDDYTCDTIGLIPEKYSGMGKATGMIRDAVTYSGKQGVKLLLRKGINNIYSEVVQTITTDKYGKYTTEDLPAGNYCVQIQGSGMITTYFNIKILGGEHIEEQDGVISQTIDPDQIRVVLTWGISPRDLDSYMLCSLSNGGGKGQVCWYNRKFKKKNEVICALDHDDVRSFGPETITLYQPKTGEYSYYVRNYSEEAEMGEYGATVRIYMGNSMFPAYSFHMPKEKGACWEVFSLNSATNRIQFKNEFLENVPYVW